MDYMPEIERARITVEHAMRDAKDLADKLPDGHAKLSALALVSQLVSASVILGIREPAVPCRLDFIALNAPEPMDGYMRRSANAVLSERLRQVDVKGWTPEHDDEEHSGYELLNAAACYAAGEPLSGLWPNGWEFKETGRYRMLVKSGALVLAELERIDRERAVSEGHGHGESVPAQDDE
ncbi:hypothetical protein RugamoR64_39620 [Duganella rhizosphaerae]|uniref:hypothetical protein n=1 Tax=Duganella rhizosphaerae TaxID=2885763 RepID=UPI0030EA9860